MTLIGTGLLLFLSATTEILCNETEFAVRSRKYGETQNLLCDPVTTLRVSYIQERFQTMKSKRSNSYLFVKRLGYSFSLKVLI